MATLSAGTDPPATRIEAVMAAIRGRIATRQLTPGARLPSVRQAAQTLGVSVSTVVEAYERLAADGVIRSRPGSGFYVSAPLAPLTLARIGPRLDREVDPLWVSRQSLEAGPEMLRPGCGWLPPEWMPEAALRRALKTAARAELVALTDYSEPSGNARLRGLLARRLGERQVPAGPDSLLVTGSGTEAIDLVCRFLLAPGDRVLIDDPCYFNFRALLAAHRVEAIGVARTPAGPDVAAFRAALAAHTPRLYVTNSALHNPTGGTLSPGVAHQILTLAEAADLVVVEDDIFADFEPVPSPRYAAFDGLNRVVQVGSFSKTLTAAVRCGFIAARADWIEELADLALATRFGPPRLSADLMLTLLSDGSYRRHVEALRDRLAGAMSATLARLEALGIVADPRPVAGMFLWGRLPDGLDAAAVARRALAEGVVLAPGDVFSVSRSAGDRLRFNVAQCADPRIFAVLERAMAETRGDLR
ncbi:PLP-dependent aminotransferase family protein [Segnochrobactraceae bacterium EtOH-i3]